MCCWQRRAFMLDPPSLYLQLGQADSGERVQAAIRDPDPVCVLENELLYGQSFPVNKKVLDPDFLLPIGKAKVQREGKDVTLVAFSKMVGYCLEAADKLEKEGISAEVINLRSLKPLDRNTILDSVAKTHRCARTGTEWQTALAGHRTETLAVHMLVLARSICADV
jgi:pyruvate dehydrogenase E1 component beta subunit